MQSMDKNDLQLTIHQVIQKYGLLDNKRHSKSFGQHFLCDFSLLKKIVSCALPLENNDIVEVGPGPCGLTRAILEFIGNNKLFCIEKDVTLKPVHDNILANSKSNLEFIYDDALKVRPQDLTSKDITIISNLPYNVGTQILINWLLDLKGISKMILMFQKEVADRICATVGTKDYGRLSVISQLLCKTEKVFNVSNMAFYPPPKVTSSIIKLTPRNLHINDIAKFEKLTGNCFQHRRKTIFSILKSHYPESDLDNVLASCEIDKLQRPETIPPEKFLELSLKLDFLK